MRRKYILIAVDDGEKITISTKADRFTSLEIIGLLENKKQDMIDQLRGFIDVEKSVNFVRKRVKED